MLFLDLQKFLNFLVEFILCGALLESPALLVDIKSCMYSLLLILKISGFAHKNKKGKPHLVIKYALK